MNMNIPASLIEEQRDIEKNAFDIASQKKETAIQKKVSRGQENQLAYGQKIMDMMIAVIVAYIMGLREKGRQNSKKFLSLEILARYSKHLADKAAGKKKAERERDPILVVAQILAWHLTRRLTSGDAVKAIAERVALDVCKQFDIPVAEWVDRKPDAMKFFTSCIREIAEGSDIFTIASGAHQGREHRIILNDEWAERIERAKLNMARNVSNFKPSLLPPIDHFDLLSGKGGYWFTQSPILKYPAKVKEFDEKGNVIAQAVHASLYTFNADTHPEWFEHFNRSQKVGYAVNEEVLNIILDMHNHDLFWEGNPIEVDTEAHINAAKAEIKQRNKNRRRYARNNQSTFKPLAKSTENMIYKCHQASAEEEVRKTEELMNQALDYSSADAFFYPAYADHRSRRYPYVSTGLTYQGDEMAKALLVYANKEELTEEGEAVVFETLGNYLKHVGDKLECSIKEGMAREWFWANFHLFKAKKYDMFVKQVNLFEEPITAMAIVNELVNHFTRDNYKTGLIVHRDARCSGASIIGTVLGCKDLMQMTSVSEWIDEHNRLGDVYMAPAKVALAMCEELALTDTRYADLLDYKDSLFSRKAFKDPVMVTSNYGGTKYGMRKMNDKLLNWGNQDEMDVDGLEMDAWEDDCEEADANEWGKDSGLTKDHKYLYDKLMEDAMANALPAQNAWLIGSQAAAKEMAFSKKHVAFINPVTNFPVVYQTPVFESKKFVASESGKKDIAITLRVPTEKVNCHKMVTSFSPNVIHSLDAGLLSLVEIKCGFNLTLIHDSIGSHPNNTRKAVKAYSEAMEIYRRHDLFAAVFENMGVETRIPRIDTFQGECATSRHALV